MEIDKLKPEEWGYIAGFIEGDGSIGISKYHQNGRPYYCSFVAVHNTEKSILDWLAKKLGGTVCQYKSRKNNTRFKGHLPVFAWTLKIKHFAVVLPKLIPWLKGAKKHRAKLVLKLQEVKKKSSRGGYDVKAQTAIWRDYNRHRQ